MAGVKLSLTGDWAKAGRICMGLSSKFQAAAKTAMLKEAHFLRGKLVTGMSSGSPGGKTYKPLSALTLAVRKLKGFGGSKPMNVTGALRGAITVVHIGGRGPGGAVFVGVKRGALSKGGKPLVNIAEIHEFGRSWVQKMTDRSRRFLFAAMRAGGLARTVVQRPTIGRSSTGTVRITIPARPTFQPVFEMYAKPADVRQRFWDNFSKAMGYDLGRPG